MRLADFILGNREPILAEWEAFARTCAPASGTMDVAALRDHADQMLVVIAADLQAPQSQREQDEKGKGKAPDDQGDAVTAAEEHGAGRAESGFTMEQMIAEYRALRASVIRLWVRAKGELVPDDVEDLMRFNEAIDQALAESVTRYNTNLSESKEIFLAILGHDLRTPLGAIYTSARFMLETEELKEPHRTLTERIAASAMRSVRMVGDLLDFTRGRLGGGIPVVPTKVSLGRIVRNVVDEIRAARPGSRIEVDTRGEERGEWDAARVGQALANLIGNAVEHAWEGTPIRVEIRGDAEEVSVRVHNHGPVIPRDRLIGIFNPMKAREEPRKPSAQGPTGNLGLGLYIAERIVEAHGGRIDVESSREGGTTFTTYLPRLGSRRKSGTSGPVRAG